MSQLQHGLSERHRILAVPSLRRIFSREIVLEFAVARTVQRLNSMNRVKQAAICWGVVALLLVTLVARADEARPAGANAMCPVMTDTPSKASRFVDYQGQRIYFCCDKCIAKFNQNP